MAYNNYYPMGYQPYQQYYPQQSYQQQMPQQIQQQQTVQQQIQNGGFVPTPNEAYARNYPVAPGNSITFKDENAPYVYTKTMGFSQLESPRFEKFRLVREDEQIQQVSTEHTETPVPEVHPDYALLSDYEALRDVVEYLDEKVKGLEEHFKKPARKTAKAEKAEGEES